MPKRPSLLVPTATVPAPAPVQSRAPSRAASRVGKVHIGGYYSPDDPVITEFRHLIADRPGSSQQTLLHEALEDFVGKHRTRKAFS